MKKITTPSRDELKTMIESIGGEGVLLSILEKFYNKMAADVMIGYFFQGKDLAVVSRNFAQFLLNAAGLKSEYLGRGPSTAHLNIPPILAGHFDRRIVLLREILSESGVSPAMMDRWIQFEMSFRPIVVAKWTDQK